MEKRWKRKARSIYYWVCEDEIFILFAYPKTKQGNLTQQQAARLQQLVAIQLNHE